MAVSTALGNLKTALTGTYDAFGFEKYAHRYFGQVRYLFNRRFDLRSLLRRMARPHARPSPTRLVSSARLTFLADQVGC